MKTTVSVSSLLRRVSQCFDNIETIAKKIREQQSSNLRVSFYHKEDLSLSFTKWSDQWNPHDGMGDKFVYTYEVTSKGIHFVSFEEKDIKKSSWSPAIRYWSISNQVNCSLLSVPNAAPKGHSTMYLFHQEKIRETLSALPAWAIAVMGS